MHIQTLLASHSAVDHPFTCWISPNKTYKYLHLILFPGAKSIKREILIMKRRQSQHHLYFITGIPIPGKMVFILKQGADFQMIHLSNQQMEICCKTQEPLTICPNQQKSILNSNQYHKISFVHDHFFHWRVLLCTAQGSYCHVLFIISAYGPARYCQIGVHRLHLQVSLSTI